MIFVNTSTHDLYLFHDRKTENDFMKSRSKTLSFMMNGPGLWILQNLQSVKFCKDGILPI